MVTTSAVSEAAFFQVGNQTGALDTSNKQFYFLSGIIPAAGNSGKQNCFP